MRNLYQLIAEYKERGSCRVATVLDGEHMGEKLFICDGQCICQTGKENPLVQYTAELNAVAESGMITLNGNPVFVELFGGKRKLVICGAGHVSMPVIQLGKSIGFEVTVLEDRPSFADMARKAGADRVICDSFENGLKGIPGSLSTYFVIVTRGHRYDTLCLKQIIEKENAYVGMMGSRRRVAMMKRALEEEGVSRTLLEKVHTPIGLAIGAETPEEIAVSILAEIIQYKNKMKRTEGYRNEILDALISENEVEGERILAEIVERKGSAPRKIGTKMVIGRDGTLTGTIGGGCAEAEIIQQARTMFAADIPHCLKKVDMTEDAAMEEGMVCGGIQLIYMEKIGNASVQGV